MREPNQLGQKWSFQDSSQTPSLLVSFCLTTLGVVRLEKILKFLDSLNGQLPNSFEVLIADQGASDLGDLINLGDYDFPISIFKSSTGASLGRNDCAERSSKNSRYLSFPNDTTSYDKDFVTELSKNPLCDVQLFEIYEDGTPRYQILAGAHPITKENVFNILEPMAFVSRQTFLDFGGLDENLGTGAKTPLQNSAIADFLMRVSPNLSQILWVTGSEWITGQKQSEGLTSREASNKVKKYGIGYLYVKCRWGFSFASLAGSIFAPFILKKHGYTVRMRFAEFIGRFMGAWIYLSRRGFYEPKLRYQLLAESKAHHDAPTVTFVISTLGQRKNELRRLIKSLLAQTESNFSILVVVQRVDEDIIDDLQSLMGSADYKIILSARGVTRGRNIGIYESPPNTKFVAFPNDTTEYSSDFLSTVSAFGTSHDVLIFELVENRKPRYRIDSMPPNLDRKNLWRAIEPATLVSRAILQSVGGFDGALGAGASTGWASGELALLLAQISLWNPKVAWFPSVDLVYGVGQNYKLSRYERLKKYFAYGRGYIVVKRIIEPNLLVILASVVSPVANFRADYSLGERATEFIGRSSGLIESLTTGLAFVRANRRPDGYL